MTRPLDFTIDASAFNGLPFQAPTLVQPAISPPTIDFFTPVSYLNRDKSFFTSIKEVADDYFDYGWKERAFVVNVDASSHKVNLIQCEASLFCTLLKIASWATVVLPILALVIKGIARCGEKFEVVQDLPVTTQSAAQPLGLRNTGNSCWLNSSLQLLNHVPAFRERMRQIPAFKQFTRAYEISRNNLQTVASAVNFNTIRQDLSARTNGQISTWAVQQDAAQVFDCLFEGPNALYTFAQRINGAVSPNQVEPMIRVDMGGQNLQQMLNARFDYQDDLGRHIQQFFPRAPNDLLIQTKRFYHYRDSSGNWVQAKNCHAIDAPLRLAVPPQFIRTFEAPNYSCDGFLVHEGDTLDGGHYISYVKAGNAWWHLSDDAVTLVTETQALNAMRNGYIFHYAKI